MVNGTHIWHSSIVSTSIHDSALYEWGVNWRTYRDRGTCTPGLVPYNKIYNLLRSCAISTVIQGDF